MRLHPTLQFGADVVTGAARVHENDVGRGKMPLIHAAQATQQVLLGFHDVAREVVVAEMSEHRRRSRRTRQEPQPENGLMIEHGSAKRQPQVALATRVTDEQVFVREFGFQAKPQRLQ